MPGPTEQTYVLSQLDVGQAISVRVTATNAQGSTNSTSAQTGPIVAKEPINTVPPVISGGSNPPVVGETLTVNNGTWTGITPITYDYFWERGGTQQPVDNLPSYTLTSADVGFQIRARVKAVNIHTAVGVDAYSASTAAVVSGGTDPGLTVLINKNFTWLRSSDLANGATGNWVPTNITPGTGTALLGGTSGVESSDPTVSGGIVTFDGTDDYVQLAANALPTINPPAGTGSGTVIVIERHSVTPSATHRVYSSESALNKGVQMGFISGSLKATIGGDTSQLELTLGTVSLNRWNVIGITWLNGSNFKGWADEVGLTSNAGDLSGIGTVTNFSSARIGRRAHTNQFYFAGDIAGILYSNQNLTASEWPQVSTYLRGLMA